MTVIAWDGKTLATDRMANDGSQKWESSKAWYSKRYKEDECIITGTGLLAHIIQMKAWYIQGGDVDSFRDLPCNRVAYSTSQLIVVRREGLYVFEGHHPVLRKEEFCAFGDGKEIAMGALAMGATAKQAVLICNDFSLHCGKGVELFSLQGGNDAEEEC